MNITKKDVRAVLEQTPKESLMTSTEIRSRCEGIDRVPDVLANLSLHFGPTSRVKIVESKKSSGYRRMMSMEMFEDIFRNFPDESEILGKKIRNEVLSSAEDREKARMEKVIKGEDTMEISIEGEGLSFKKRIPSSLFGPIVTFIETSKNEA